MEQFVYIGCKPNFIKPLSNRLQQSNKVNKITQQTNKIIKPLNPTVNIEDYRVYLHTGCLVYIGIKRTG